VSKFGDAFAAARKAGKKVFTFNGKKYNTRTKDDEMGSKTTKKVSSGLTKKTPIGPSKSDLKPVTVSAKRKTAPAPKKKAATAGDNYKKMAKKPGGVPGKAKPTKKKAAPKRKRNTVILNTPKAR